MCKGFMTQILVDIYKRNITKIANVDYTNFPPNKSFYFIIQIRNNQTPFVYSFSNLIPQHRRKKIGGTKTC